MTLDPRWFLFFRGRKREAQRVITQQLQANFKPRYEPDGSVEIDFSKQSDLRADKERVAAELDRIDPGWPRLFRLYPTEDSLRDRGY